MGKRAKILDALQELLREGKAGTASVQDIATKAGIAKGGMYYYFKSKEDALDALAQRQYAHVISDCRNALDECTGNALDKVKLLLYVYRSTAVDASVDRMLHQTENAAIHQKSMAYIHRNLSPLLADIFVQGVDEGLFQCDFPGTLADIVLSMIVFLLDPGLFVWDEQGVLLKLKGLAGLLEKNLSSSSGAFSFLYESWTNQHLT